MTVGSPCGFLQVRRLGRSPVPEGDMHNRADSALLLRAAREVAGELDLERLVHRLRPWLTQRDGVTSAGMAVVGTLITNYMST